MTALADLVEALRTAQRSVFRLEVGQHYDDDPQWQSYRRGERWWDNADLRAWCDLVRANHERGVSMRRVHLVIPPWTAYVRFEVGEHYPYNRRAGEDVQIVEVETPWEAPDFWLVDDQRAWLLDYAEDGAMTVVPAAEQDLPELRAWRDRALEAVSIGAGLSA